MCLSQVNFSLVFQASEQESPGNVKVSKRGPHEDQHNEKSPAGKGNRTGSKANTKSPTKKMSGTKRKCGSNDSTSASEPSTTSALEMGSVREY